MPKQNQTLNDIPRKRGRPSGKNRVPLSLEERRARNALYERERRNETADALAQLAEAVGCDPNISNADLLATVISQIQRATDRNSAESIDDLLRINGNLESQIATLQSRLGVDAADLDLLNRETDNSNELETHQNYESQSDLYTNYEVSKKQNKKRKRTQNAEQQRKRTKIQSQYSDISDSGVESQSPIYSQDNEQYVIETQSPLQLPTESEQHMHVESQAQIELQTELYNQIFRSDAVEVEPEWNQNGTQCEPTPYYMESIARSLITIPSILPPQQEPPDQFVQQPIDGLESLINIEANDVNAQTECDVLPPTQPTLDLLTDREKGILTDWMNQDFMGDIDGETPMRTYAIDEIIDYL